MRARVTAALFVLGGIAACGSGSSAAPVTTAGAVEANAVVDHIVDGDTIDVLIGDAEERVRLIGIDTPEVEHAASSGRPAQAAECFGDEATRFIAELLPIGTAIRLERDVVPRDDYGRTLAYVYRASDGTFINHELVRQGYAQPLTFPPNVTFSERFVEAARIAEAEDAGLWAACR